MSEMVNLEVELVRALLIPNSYPHEFYMKLLDAVHFKLQIVSCANISVLYS